MKIKTLQWNIGGGKIRDENSDPTEEQSYSIDDLGYIATHIKKYSPDIITLVETHTNSTIIQAEVIAKKLGYKYWVNDVYDKSHLEKGMDLGQAIVSRYPFKSHVFDFFYNPKFEIIRPNGEKWISPNKGLTTCKVDINGKLLTVMTLHLIPYRKFGVEPTDPRAEKARKSIVNLIATESEHILLQGDFNVDDSSLKEFLPEVIAKSNEVLLEDPTTPKSRRYDHIVYKGMTQVKSSVEKTLTDHFIVYSEFEL